MVRALLDGSKTQTRRIAKIVKSMPDGRGWDCLQKPGTHECIYLLNGVWSWRPYGGAPDAPYPHIEEYCPYGQPGDRLWVKETHKAFIVTGRKTGITYAAGGDKGIDSTHEGWSAMWNKATGKWRPSIFMPRWASRITLELTAVRVERLQDISEADAKAEGVETTPGWSPSYGDPCNSALAPEAQNAKAAYADLWESINGADSWDKNPWVWVLEFRRITP
jgi:hypothetical protein